MAVTDEYNDENERLAAEARAAGDAERKLTASINSLISALQTERSGILGTISAISAKQAKYTQSIAAIQRELQLSNATYNTTQKQLALQKSSSASLERQLRRLQELERSTAGLTDAQKEQKQSIEDRLARSKISEDRFRSSMDGLSAGQNSAKTQLKLVKFERLAAATSDVIRAMTQMAESIKQTQYQFGVAGGQAAAIQFGNIQESFQSYVDSIKSGFSKRPITAKEIGSMREASQNAFGGVLTDDAAKRMATEAAQMGVSAEQYIKARQAFLAQNLNDVNEAQAGQKKFIGEFEKRGLTSKDAMAAIAQYSELLARNGGRFQGAFAKAAVDAKRIGIDLNKVSQIGDNIINDFEGFLEKQAELGAMGFNFDSSRLAEISETGSDTDLFNELRSQLAGQGKDITKLRRSERLALESAYGINISDMLKLAGKTPEGAGGQKTKTPEELQEEANSILNNIYNIMLGLAPLAGIAAPLITYLATRRIAKKFAQELGEKVAEKTAQNAAKEAAEKAAKEVTENSKSVISKIEDRFINLAAKLEDRFPKLAERVLNTGLRVTERMKSVGARAAALAERIPGRKLLGRVAETAGPALGRAGKFLGGAARGVGRIARFGGRRLLGPALAFLDAREEYNAQRAQGVGKGTAMAAGGVKAASLWAGFSIGSSAGAAAGGGIGTAIGAGFGGVGAAPGAAIGTAVGWILGGIAGVIGGEKAANWINENITKKFSSFLSAAFTKVGGMWDSATSAIGSTWKSAKDTVSGWFGGKPSTPTKPVTRANDLISRAGYGQRSLITPSGIIALNDKDNIVAYGDDVISSGLQAGIKQLPYGKIARGLERVENTALGRRYLGHLGHKAGDAGFSTGLGIDNVGKLAGVKLGTLAKFVESGIVGGFERHMGQRSFIHLAKHFAKQHMFDLAKTGKKIPILGGLISGGLAGYDEYKAGGSLTKSILKGLFVGGATTGASLLAGAATGGNPLAATVGGYGGEWLSKKLFEKMFGTAIPEEHHKGGIVGGRADEVPAMLQRGEAVLTKLQTGSLNNLIEGFNKIGLFGNKLNTSMDKLNASSGGLAKLTASSGALSKFAAGDRKGALKNFGYSLLDKGVAKYGKNIPGLGDAVAAFKKGGLKAAGSSLLSTALKNKVPGVSQLMGAYSAYKTGGVKGLLGSVGKSIAKQGIGKSIGGAIGTLIPIPGAGTMIGSMLGGKVGNLVGGLFGKKKPQVATTTPDVAGVTDLSTMMGSQQKPSEIKVEAPKVDTTGIEQKLNNLINALQGMQVNLDGNKVGQMLVANEQRAASTGIFGAQRP